MIDWLITNKEWVFSGIGILILSGVTKFIIHIFKKRNTSAKMESRRTINMGDYSTYIENSEGPIEIH
jgi:histone H3/H4